MTAAALGTDLVLTTLDGEEKIEIRPGTQSGAVLHLRGKGVPKLRSLHPRRSARPRRGPHPDPARRRTGTAAARARRAARRGRCRHHQVERTVRQGPRRLSATVTPPLFLLADLPSGNELYLVGDEGHHAARVRRVRVGEAVLVADGAGTLLRCVVREVTADGVALRIEARDWVPVGQPRLVVVQALPKGERAELAVEMLTELGVDEIVPWAAARCVVQWHGARGDKALARWRSTALAAAKQSRRARIPTVTRPRLDAGRRRPGAECGVLARAARGRHGRARHGAAAARRRRARRGRTGGRRRARGAGRARRRRRRSGATRQPGAAHLDRRRRGRRRRCPFGSAVGPDSPRH